MQTTTHFTQQTDEGLKRNNFNEPRLKISRNKQVSISHPPHLPPLPPPLFVRLSRCLYNFLSLSSALLRSPLSPPSLHLSPFTFYNPSVVPIQNTPSFSPPPSHPDTLLCLLHLSALLISSALAGFTYSTHPVACNDLAWVCVGKSGKTEADWQAQLS